MATAVMNSKSKFLDRSLRIALVTAAFAIVLMSLKSAAAVITSEYYVHVLITEPEGAPVRRVRTSLNWEYSFNAGIHSLPGTAQQTADIYFGAMTPGDSIFTWVENGNGPTLVTGLQPLLTAIPLSGGLETSIGHIRGRDLKYRFTGSQPKGMYTIFAIVVISGREASNPDNWVGVSMAPLFVE
jgi:hypothetical protein